MLSLHKDENRSQLARGGLHTEQETSQVTRWICIGTAMREFHAIQDPHTRDTRDKIAFSCILYIPSGRLTN